MAVWLLKVHRWTALVFALPLRSSIVSATFGFDGMRQIPAG